MANCNASKDCSGQIEDGYCNYCGNKPVEVQAGSPSTQAPVQHVVTAANTAGNTAGNVLAQPTSSAKAAVCTKCGGTSFTDNYCDNCGDAFTPPVQTPAGTSSRTNLTGKSSTALSGRTGPGGTRRSRGTRVSGSRKHLGLGMVDVPDVPKSDPLAALMPKAEVPLEKRTCAGYKADGSECGNQLKKEKGFCPQCRTRYNYVPGIDAGELVADQYRIKGCIAFGGMGWIYLAHDETLNRYVVLKGLVNKDDKALQEAAVAERQFLAEVKHPNIMSVYTVVQHTNAKGTAAYTVTEFIGGKTLKSLRKKANAPLPVAEVLAYMHPVLGAFGYMHSLGLIYNDFKPDNVMVEDGMIKVIDLGGVCRASQTNVDIFSTVGYAAPELATTGPSYSSDVYTIGRAIMVLSTEAKGFSGTHQHKLRTPQEEPVYAKYPSFYRLLQKSCHPDPTMRFQSCDEFTEQLVGVLREVVAIDTGSAHPAESRVFFGDPLNLRDLDELVTIDTLDIESLPLLRMETQDPASTFIQANLGSGDPRRQVPVLLQAVEQFPDSVEAKLATARNLIRLGQFAEAEKALADVEALDGFDWRVIWYRALSAIAQKNYAEAAAALDTCYAEVPGEAAPKLGIGVVAELGGDYKRAIEMYDAVSRTDPSYATAAFGLARSHAASGNRAEAVAALARIPQTSNLYVDAQKKMAVVLIDNQVAPPVVSDLERAASTIEALVLQGLEKVVMVREVMGQALVLLEAKVIQPSANVKLFGNELSERAVRLSLEKSLRELARLSQNRTEQLALIDRANSVRPQTLI